MPNPNRDAKGRFAKGPWTVTAGAAVLVIGALSVGGGAGAGGAASSTGSAAGQSIRANVTKSKTSAQKGRRDEAWRGMRLKRVKDVTRHAANCAVNSYGDVRQFFVRTPCRSLDRMLFALADGQGNTVVVSVAWVTMSGSGNAGEFRKLADTQGTGNVSPLAGGLVGVAGVKFTGRYYDSRQAAKLVVVAEVEPLGGTPDPALMDGVAEVAAEFPPP
ncbi:MAG: hypothetical protein ABW224_08425 [Kibdelosporangium sp.]